MKIPRIMGIINCTPDSFYQNSRTPGVESAIQRAVQFAAEGADILDIGGESSRPGSAYVDEEEELRRVVPVIFGIREAGIDLPISIDTRKSKVAEAALDAGATMINDISAARDDTKMIHLAAEREVPLILMHMQGTPDQMQKNPTYNNVCEEIRLFLLDRAETCLSGGIKKENIIFDPGIGFGKRFEDNIALLRNLPLFSNTSFSLLIGLSRKRFLGEITGRSEEMRGAASLAAHAFCAFKGVDILRVHDVADTVDMIKVYGELLWI